MTIHPEGRQFLATAAVIILGVTALLWLWLPFWAAGMLTAGLIVLMAFLVQFFRHPARDSNPATEELLSPADGKVVVKEIVYEPEYLQQQCLQVSVFMGPFDVHVNRVPADGKLAYYQYHPGRYLAAYNPKSSALNEQNAIGWQTQHGTILLRQIAGVMARRIRFYLQEGQPARQGEQLGFIKFGSRTDILLPVKTQLQVEVGQQVYAGKTVLGTWP